ncbi:alpha/beta fold hydrolase [Corynebacterium halotolerans]|uniref:AB hydrolase-1 domain-containing protein n=1 Tax=Corynebacterium halotolerans YIM 70093 = DSM 44683 TaxID=1121362 RepID=M1P9P0_9CORY|nr:alpha/beta hydrolase [Corynebacterium halotolerans]AGF73391.1 hypothetical protein A605_11975 [Corynebacterium halotolerans YIM 70093 = DSM 44683]
MPHRGTLPELPPLADAPGTPVVLLHGLMGSPGNYERTARRLLDAGVPVAAPEYGRHGTVGLERSLAEITDGIGEVLGHSPTGRIDIVGHSLGGLMGLRLAHYLPGKVRTLVGLGAAFRGLPPARNRLLGWGIGTVMGVGARELMVPQPLDAVVPEGTRVVSIVSDADRVVPTDSSRLGELVEVHGVRHEHLPGLAAEITDALGWRP